MKRIILASVSFAALAISATAATAASRESTVTQSGDRQGAVIHQETSSSAKSTVTQSGADNAFNILQGGAGNTSTVTQIGVARTGNASNTGGAYIAEGPSKSNFGNVVQQGFVGKSTLTQTNNNRALVEQTGTSFLSESDVTQNQPDVGNSFTGRDYQNSAVVRQAGNGRVEIRQTGNTADASEGNIANASQDTSAFGANSLIVQHGRNTALTEQSGFGASSSITQGGVGNASRDNLAEVRQDGDSDSIIEQINGNNSSASVDQRGGSFNYSFIRQSKAIGSNLSKVTVNQRGSDNQSDVSQSGQGAIASVNQTQTIGASNGDRSNKSTIDQVAYSTATVNQTGDENDSVVRQGSLFGLIGSTATVTQNGVRANSTVLQTGAGTLNAATVNQTGVDLRSGITQTGLLDKATINQSGFQNTSSATQGGILNTLFVTQSGSGSESIATQSGDNNYASVTQQTANNLSNVTQSGSSNATFVTQ